MDRGVITGQDLEGNACPYVTLSDSNGNANTLVSRRIAMFVVLASVFVLVIGSAFFLLDDGGKAVEDYIIKFGVVDDENIENVPPRKERGVEEGVSSKESGVNWDNNNNNNNNNEVSPALNSFSWTNDELRWQRTAYHFQPEKNWMNDPNGPLYYRGWYHLFYQYNQESAVWGNITWGHAVSRDLIHWQHLPLAMVPDHWYDANGAWTGSATILPSGQVVMIYTGSTKDLVQVQNLALPADPNDPLLVDWVKSESNPVLFPPSGIDDKDFRDPTTAWYEPSQSAWRVAIGSKDRNHAGVTLLYQTKDFVNYELLPELLHLVNGTGMWECVDFYPVAKNGMLGLDTSVNGPEVKHVLKASFDDDRNDYYAIGFYDAGKGTWTPDDPLADVGMRYRYDYGKFYAAKTFYDQGTKRRVLWGWIGEADSETSDVLKGWASVMGVPRTVRLDEKTRTNLVQWPVEEVERLRLGGRTFNNINIPAGSVVPLDVGMANQLDITVEFEVSKEAWEKAAMMDDDDASVGYNCSSSAGAAGNGAFGPFGLLVLADEGRTEQTAIYFYIAKSTKQGKFDTFICQDETKSSAADDIVKRVAGSFVPVLDGENLSLRVLVDHSVVETFAQGGRTCITSRVYPTRAIYGPAKIFLFNNATYVDTKAKSVNTWELSSAFIRAYDSPSDE